MADRYALLWSGGKDSALALARARRRGLGVTLLLNFYDPATERVRFHATRRELVAAQAARAGVAIRQLGVPWAEYDARFRALLASLREEGFAGVVLGDIHLADVRAWYEDRVRAAGLEHVEPLWGDAPAELVREFVASGGRAVITCVELAKLDDSWLGRLIDPAFPADVMATGIDPCGENGEYHSFAFDGPMFAEPVPWEPGETRRADGFAQLDLRDARDAIALAVDDAVLADAALAADAVARRPKAWGAIAGRAVIACRERLGRAPTDAERRAVWDALWRRLERLALSRGG